MRLAFGYVAMLMTMAFALFAVGWIAGYAWRDVEGEKAVWGFLGFGAPAIVVGAGTSWLLRVESRARKVFASCCLAFAAANALALFVGMFQSINDGSIKLALTVFFGFGFTLLISGIAGIKILASERSPG